MHVTPPPLPLSLPLPSLSFPQANQRTTGKALVSQLVSELERYQKGERERVERVGGREGVRKWVRRVRGWW